MRSLDELSLEPRERAALAAAVRLLKERFPVERVVLFGSRARGEGDAESDLDILVLTARPLHWRERHALVDALFPIGLAHKVLLSPLTIDSDAWRDGLISVLPIHTEVERDGVSL